MVTAVQPVPNRAAIEIVASPREPVDVDLVGVRYTVVPPKAALAIKLAIAAGKADTDPALMDTALDTWLLQAFGKKNALKVRERLDDPDDQLDFDHVTELMNALTERVIGGPTG